MFTDIKVIEHSEASTLGETPIYCDWLKKVIWVDILEHKLFLMNINTLRIKTIKFPFLVSAALPTTEEGILVLTSTEGILLYDLESKKVMKKLSEYPEKNTRPNEAQITPNGDLIFGTMGHNAESKAGSWYIFKSKTRALTQLESGVSIPNTVAFLNGSIIFGDTATQQLFSVDVNNTDWATKKAITPKINGGGLDGSYLSKEDYLINARWGHSKTSVFDAQNNMDIIHEQELPVIQPTSCVIVSENNENKIYFTSAKLRLENPNEHDGKLLSAKTTCAAKPVNRFQL